MRFLVDECTGPAVAAWLREQGHEVFSVFDEDRGSGDDAVIARAAEERWVLTNDKGFGEKVFRDQRLHSGVVLLRLFDERASVKIRVLSGLLASYADRLSDSFIVVTESRVRFARQ